MGANWWFAAGNDGENEPTIWLVRGHGDTKPQPVFRKCDLTPATRLLWPTITRALIETDISNA